MNSPTNATPTNPTTSPNGFTLYGPDGQPLERTRLLREDAVPTLTGIRSTDSHDPSTGLTPVRLANLLRDSEHGNPSAYFELAERIEEKDLHYLAVLRTRRLTTSALETVVEAASDDAQDVAIADFVREIIEGDAVRGALFDILDAIGKGISVTEIIWDLSGAQWKPQRLQWVDPRFLEFDRVDGRTPLLRAMPGEPGAGQPARAGSLALPMLKPLTPYKFIVCNIQSKSGLPARSGLARPAAWAYLFKNFNLKSWVQFAEIYGQPLRVGKYQPNATSEEKRTLLRALASIASDAAAIVPQSMAIEFIEAAGNRDGVMYEKMCAYLDQQMSKLVLGQTGTTDAIAGGYSVGKVQDKVRGDICDADAAALAMTLRRDLVKPLVDLNFGPRARYPNLRFQSPENFDVPVMADALTKLVPLGMKVQMSTVRDKLGFGDPEAGAELLTPPAAPAMFPPAAPPTGLASAGAFEKLSTALAAANIQLGGRVPDVADQVADKAAQAAEPALAANVDRVRAIVEAAASYDDLTVGLLQLANNLPQDAFAAALRDGLMIGHLAGAASVAASGTGSGTGTK